MAAPGDVDMVISAEWMEAGRAIQRGLVTPDWTTLIASTHRAFAVLEKETLGDGIAGPSTVTVAAWTAYRRFIAFDMAGLAEQAGSVVSSVLFGALCTSNVFPFSRSVFEATITDAGIGVQASLRGLALGCDAVRSPPPLVWPSRAVPSKLLQPVGHAAYDTLLARAKALPPQAHAMLAEGLRHVVAYQDIDYATAYLDAVESVSRFDPAPSGRWQSNPSPKPPPNIARAMAYDDVIRVAVLKIQPTRNARVRQKMAVRPTQLVTTKFMHPRMEELLALLPPFLALAAQRRGKLVAWLDRVVCGLRRIGTDTITGFQMHYMVAGVRGWRRRTLRHAREMTWIDQWLASVRSVARHNPALAMELFADHRLIKGYSETHARSLDKYARVMVAKRLRYHPDAVLWVRRLREAALKEAGHVLNAALKTVACFLDERTAA